MRSSRRTNNTRSHHLNKSAALLLRELNKLAKDLASSSLSKLANNLGRQIGLEERSFTKTLAYVKI